MSVLRISSKGISLIKHFEELHDGDLSVCGLQPKMCPSGIWTVGWGRALKHSTENRFLKGEKDKELAYSLYPSISIEKAEQFLSEDLKTRETQVLKLGLKLNQHEFDSLVSFVYNVGIGALKTSTLLRRVRAKDEPEKIISAFGMWRNGTVNGVRKPLPGLIRRRRSEAELFLFDRVDFYL